MPQTESTLTVRSREHQQQALKQSSEFVFLFCCQWGAEKGWYMRGRIPPTLLVQADQR